MKNSKNIWLITVGENLPLPQSKSRLLRTAVLAERLQREGHTVTWWSSTFDHMGKKHWFPEETDYEVLPNYRLILLHGDAYQKNVSLSRIRNHRQVAQGFAQRAIYEPKPDVIFCSLPTLELCAEATRYAKTYKVPIAFDIRDLWPDALTDVAPKWARPFSKLLLASQFAEAGFALRNSDGIVGISESYLDWGLRYAGRARGENGKYDVVLPLGYRPAQKPALASEEREKTSAKTLEGMGIAPDRFVCWFVGMFGRTYDLSTVIQAARSLEKTHSKVLFVLSGDGEFADSLKAEASGLSNILFTGWVNTEQIACLSERAQVGLMAYALGAPQSLPNKLFEYLSAGIPILTSLKGETSALLEKYHCGLVYSSQQPESLVESVLRLASNSVEHAAMSKNALCLFQTQFAEEIIYGGLVDYLTHLAQKNYKDRKNS